MSPSNFDFKQYGAFFAFGDKQFEEGKAKDKTKEDYTSCFSGLIDLKGLFALKSNYKQLLEDYNNYNDTFNI